MKFTVSVELNLPDRRRLTKKQKLEIMYFMQQRISYQAVIVPECVTMGSIIGIYIIEKGKKQYLQVLDK